MRRQGFWGLAVAGLVLAACTPSSLPEATPTPTHTPGVGDPIVANALTLPAVFDPTDTLDPYVTRIAGLLQRGLYRYDAKGKAVLEVAESVETTDDRVFRVVLAPGWRFANGEPVTADSFVDAWSRVADPARPRLRRDLLAPIDGFTPARATATPPAPISQADGRSPRLRGLTVIDPQTFTITLSHPQPDFTQRLGHVVFAPLPDVAFTDPDRYRRTPVGNGPYRLEGAWRARGPVVLRPEPTYTGEDPARNAGVDFRVYTDPTAALTDIDAGRLDVLDVLPTDRLADYRDVYGERSVGQPVGAVLDLVFPTAARPWAGPDGIARRRAVSMAIDRDAIARDVLAGTDAPATDLATPLVEGHSRDMCGPDCRLDPRKAAEARTQAGGVPPVTIAYAADSGTGPVAQAVCADIIENLQVDCSPRVHATESGLREAVRTGKETGPYLSRYRMDYPLLENFLLPRFTPGAPTNTSAFANPAATAALDRAARAPATERISRFQAAEARILQDMPVVPLFDLDAAVVSSTGVTDLRVDVFGAPDYTALRRP